MIREISRCARASRVPAIVATVSAIVLGTAGAAAADDGGAVSLEVDACVDADAEAVRRLFALELHTSIPGAGERGGEPVRAELGCDGRFVVLEVHDPITGKSLIRRIDPGPRTGRDRLLALAVMELLVASWTELEATPEPIAPPADPVADDEVRSEAREVVRRRLKPPQPTWRSRALVRGGAWWAGGVHGGLAVAFGRDSSRGWGWAADVTVGRRREALSLGDATIDSITGAMVVGLAYRRGPLTVRAAGGARLGAASIEGDPAGDGVTGGEVSGVVGGPLVRVGAEVAVLGGLAFVVELESGYHLFGVEGLVDGSEETAVDGFWVAADLGVGWTW